MEIYQQLQYLYHSHLNVEHLHKTIQMKCTITSYAIRIFKYGMVDKINMLTV